MTTTVGDAILTAARRTRPAVQPPAPGVALLVCACGTALDETGMRWAPKVRANVVPAIVCDDCARNRGW